MSNLPPGFEMVLRACGQQDASEITRNVILIAYKDGIAQGRRQQAEKDADIIKIYAIRNTMAQSTNGCVLRHLEDAIRRAAGEQDA